MEYALMLEGQNGLTWARWQKLVGLVEDLGFAGLYRSDHFTNSRPPDIESLELWTSLTWLAGNTKRIEFGPLVSPISFRHPAMTARMASAVDDLSGGRLILGLGAGWQEREHHLYGFDLLEPKPRFDRFEEGLQIISNLFNSETSVHFDGKYFQLRDASLLPRPAVKSGPRILIGGNGKRTLHLVSRYAVEWNAVMLTDEEFAKRNLELDNNLIKAGRKPQDVKRSMMIGTRFAKTTKELNEKVAPADAQKLRERGHIVGAGDEILPQLDALAKAGVQRVMLQWLDLDDLEGLKSLAQVLFR